MSTTTTNITSQLDSGECLVAMEAAIRALTGGGAAMDAAIAAVIAARVA